MSSNQFLYVYSCDLDANVTVKIGTLEGKLDKPTFDELARDPSLEHCVALQRQGSDGVHHPQQDLFVTCSVRCLISLPSMRLAPILSVVRSFAMARPSASQSLRRTSV